MNSFKNWKLFPNLFVECDECNIMSPDFDNTFFVLETLFSVMNPFLPIVSIPNTMISISQSYETPICIREQHTIQLNCSYRSWCQLTYQLAHELCHMCIPDDVTNNLRWFEESICELSSYYFLPLLTDYWKRHKINLISSDSKPYATFFSSYVVDDMRKASSFNLTGNLQKLYNNCYDRHSNAYVAIQLLPIFQSYPNTWKSVPFLHELDSSQNFSDSLKQWLEIAPTESHSGLLQICQLFAPKVPFA